MTAISELRAKAAAKYPAYSIEFEDGATFSLKSIMELSKPERKEFSTASKRLNGLDEDEDLDGLHSEFVSILASVSNDREAVSARLGNETLGFLSVVFEEYAGSVAAGSKSA